jgi:dolichyl-phosphate-mannose-protein mannosyltransferase
VHNPVKETALAAPKEEPYAEGKTGTSVSEGFKFVEFGVPLLIALWIFRELFAFLRRTPDVGLPPHEPVERTDHLIAASIAVIFYLLCLWRLAVPNTTYFDEVHHVRTAMEYIDGLEPHEWTHPPLAKLIMAASMKVWGTDFDPREGVWKPDATYPTRACLSWRFPSVCFGALSLAAMFALTRALFGNRFVATAGTVLLALDGVFFVQSRIAMTNIYTVFFILTGTLGTWQYVKRGDRRWLLLTGLALGCALATRWSSLWAWGLNGVILLWQLFAYERPSWTPGSPVSRETAKWIATMTVTMGLIPLFVYMLAYVPFVLQGNGDLMTKLFTSGEPAPVAWSKAFQRDFYASGHGWFKVLNQQKDMWNYHSGLKEGHPYSSTWWTWPLMLRPVWYYFVSKDGTDTGIWAIGNAAVWWASVPALLCAAYLARKERNPALGIVSLLGFGMWLAWAIKPRPLDFMHYFFECVPFTCIALAYLGWRLYHSGDEVQRRFAVVFASAAATWFVFYYPLLSALTVPDGYFRLHIWLDRLWI